MDVILSQRNVFCKNKLHILKIFILTYFWSLMCVSISKQTINLNISKQPEVINKFIVTDYEKQGL